MLTVAVLCRSGGPIPDLSAMADRAEIRIADENALGDALDGADVVLAWDYGSDALLAAWSQASTVRWVHVAAAGVERILFDALVDSPVVVTNARGVFDRPVAEFVLGYIVAVAKDIYQSHDLQRAHQWRPRETSSLAAQTALVVGTGAIGREIGRLLRAVGLQVRGAGRRPSWSDPDFGSVLDSAQLAAAVGWADHVVVVTPLTAQTRGLIDGSVIAAMKPTAHLINVARGACVVQSDLVMALREGRLGGASLDVVDHEPLGANDPLWSVPRLHLTPHMAGDVHGYREQLAAQFVTEFNRFADGRPLMSVVDKRLGYVSSTSA